MCEKETLVLKPTPHARRGPAANSLIDLVGAILTAALLGAMATASPADPIPPPIPTPSPTPWTAAVVSDGRQVRVATAAELIAAFEDLQDGDTVLLADGVYEPARTLLIDGVRNVSIHGASRDPKRVVWRGRGWARRDRPNELLRVAHADGVDIGWITFEEAHMYGVKVEAENRPANVHIHHCRFREIGVRHIKGSTSLTGRASGGSIRFCSFENTRVPDEDWQFQGNYVTAIDMMALENWVIADNTFRNLKGRTGGGRAAIFIWVRSRNVVVERNVILHCDRGVAFGNPSDSTIANPDGAPTFHMVDGVIRDNHIVPGPDAGIEISRVENVQIQNNIIYRPERPDGATWWSNRGIRLIQGIQGVEVTGNLVHGGGIQCEDGDGAWEERDNQVGHFEGWFVDPEKGDFQRTEKANPTQGAGPRPR